MSTGHASSITSPALDDGRIRAAGDPLVVVSAMSVLECFDTAGWVTGRTKPVLPVPCDPLPLNQCPLPLNRHRRSSGDCLEGKGENYQVCSMQYCVQQLCTV